MKKFILKYHKRLWLSGLAGMGFGFLTEIVHGIWAKDSINSWLMMVFIIGAAVGAWYILTNNKDFKKS